MISQEQILFILPSAIDSLPRKGKKGTKRSEYEKEHGFKICNDSVQRAKQRLAY